MVNYPRFIERAIELMWMPSVIESPSGRMPEKAPRWDLTGTKACGGEKVFLRTPLMLGEYLRIYRGGTRVRGPSRGPQARGRALEACGLLGTLLALSPSHVGVFWSKKIIIKFYSVWTLFEVPFRKSQKQGKTKTDTGH